MNIITAFIVSDKDQKGEYTVYEYDWSIMWIWMLMQSLRKSAANVITTERVATIDLHVIKLQDGRQISSVCDIWSWCIAVVNERESTMKIWCI